MCEPFLFNRFYSLGAAHHLQGSMHLPFWPDTPCLQAERLVDFGVTCTRSFPDLGNPKDLAEHAWLCSSLLWDDID
jgi:hypothetical protein